jgi:hypothetical protein
MWFPLVAIFGRIIIRESHRQLVAFRLTLVGRRRHSFCGSNFCGGASRAFEGKFLEGKFEFFGRVQGKGTVVGLATAKPRYPQGYFVLNTNFGH